MSDVDRTSNNEVSGDLPSPLVAFQGEVEILNATWSLNDGRRVELRICGEAYHRQHPFKVFQQKRNGHVGTRFKASFARCSTGELLSTMELMLCGWKDSSSIGQSVTFWLDDDPAVHPFCGCTPRKAQTPGDMFALVLVEVNDDERVVDQHREAAIRSAGGVGGERPGSGPPGEARGGDRGDKGDGQRPGGAAGPVAQGAGGARTQKKLSSSAHLLLTSPMFVQYLKETKPNLVRSWTSDVARAYAKKLIGVESLSDLDRDRGAVQRYQNLVRQPYDRWAHQDPR